MDVRVGNADIVIVITECGAWSHRQCVDMLREYGQSYVWAYGNDGMGKAIGVLWWRY